MIGLFVATTLAAQASVAPELKQIAQAIEASRLEQARQMLANASAAGQSGPELDRLHADFAFVRKNWSEAQGRYGALLHSNPRDWRSAERAAIASIMLGERTRASTFVDQAIASGRPSWKAWNIKGVLSDFEGDWAGADDAFANATRLAPQNAEIVNNHGWSLLLRGEWARALAVLEQAVILDSGSQRIRNNVELARAAVAEDLPRRRTGERNSDYAARLNDAGVIAKERGDRGRAIAAFSQALEVSDKWYTRAANNLQQAQTR